MKHGGPCTTFWFVGTSLHQLASVCLFANWRDFHIGDYSDSSDYLTGFAVALLIRLQASHQRATAVSTLLRTLARQSYMAVQRHGRVPGGRGDLTRKALNHYRALVHGARRLHPENRTTMP